MIKTFIKRPVFTTMFILVLVVFGIQAYPQIGVDLNPDVELPMVAVSATYTGASPEEMETLVTKPIEDRVSQVSGIKTLSSSIREGYSQTMLEFEIGVDPREMAAEVREKVATLRNRLPDGMDEPVVQRIDINAQSIASYSFASDIRSVGEVRRICEDLIKTELQMLDGVSEVTVAGGGIRALKVNINTNKLNGYNLSVQQIINKINANNINTPGGKIRDGENSITVRTLGKYKTLDDLRNVVVGSVDDRPIYITDIAEVIDDWEDEETFGRANMVPSVMVFVRKQSQTNTVEVIDRVNAALEELRRNDIPEDIKLDIVKDQSKYVRDSIADVWTSILFGGFLALTITYMFLQDLRATLIAGIVIPTSIIATFFMMKTMGFTLNNISLMGLSLAVGFLIDDAIVLIENIFRHMSLGKKPIVAAADATNELGLAILATSMSLLAVFVPIGSMGETIGQFFKQFGLTVAFAVTFSTISAYSFTPMLAAYWLKDYSKDKVKRNKHVQAVLDKFEGIFKFIKDEYNSLMKFAFKHPWKIIGISLFTLVFNFGLVPFLGTEFQPIYDSGEFTIRIKAPAGTSIEKMKELTKPIEEEIIKVPEVRVTAMYVGGRRTNDNEGSIDVKLVPSNERSRGMIPIMNELRGKFRQVKDLSVNVVTGQSPGGGDSRPVQVGLRGNDITILNRYAQNLAELIRQEPGAADVDVSGSEEAPEIAIRLNPVRASELGFDASSVGAVVNAAFLGKSTANSFTSGNNDYDIIIQLDKNKRRTVDDVSNLLISNSNGQYVRLGDIATVDLESGPTSINREAKQRQVVVYANTVGISPGELIATIQNKLLPELNMDVGYRYKMVGQADIMNRSFAEVAKAIILAIVMIYMVLAAEFESYTQPFVIMMSLPFAIIGAVVALLAANQTANMMSMIGFTMLLGLATKNAILLVDYANQARDKGLSIKEALLEACDLRIRPIFMTTLSTILAMVPIALGIGAGAELRQSMGVVLVGGLITSTLLTLVVVPLIYLLTETWKEKNNMKRDISNEI